MVIQKLICDYELSFASIEQTFSIDFKYYFRAVWPQLEQMAADGLVELSEHHLIVQPAGRLLVRAICMLFDHYLTDTTNQRYSRII